MDSIWINLGKVKTSAHRVEPLLPFDISEATYLFPNVTEWLSTEDLLAHCTCQLKHWDKELALIHECIVKARLSGIVEFMKKHKNTMVNYDFKGGSWCWCWTRRLRRQWAGRGTPGTLVQCWLSSTHRVVLIIWLNLMELCRSSDTPCFDLSHTTCIHAKPSKWLRSSMPRWLQVLRKLRMWCEEVEEWFKRWWATRDSFYSKVRGWCEVVSQAEAGTSIIARTRELSAEQDIGHISFSLMLSLMLCSYHLE